MFDPLVMGLLALLALPFCGFVWWRAWKGWQTHRRTGEPLDPEHAWVVTLPGVFLFGMGAVPLLARSGLSGLPELLAGLLVLFGVDVNGTGPADPRLLLIGRVGLGIMALGGVVEVVLRRRRRAVRQRATRQGPAAR